MIRRSKLGQGRLDRGRRQPSIYSRTQQDIVRRDFKKGFLAVFLIITLIGITYLILFSPVFRIKRVELNDLKYQDRANVEKPVEAYKTGFILNQNLITFNRGGLEKKILAIPGIKSVRISKKYPDALSLVVAEREPAFVWQVLDHRYLVDESGMIWGNFEDKFRDTPVVIDTKNIPTEIGKKPVPPSFATFVMDLKKDFETITGAKMVKLEVVDTTSELKAYSNSSWYAYFDTTRTAKNELINLARVVEEARRSGKRSLEYIDLRIDNKIFYK